MSRSFDFERFARTQATAMAAGLRGMGGRTFTESDRAVMQVICAAMQLWASGKLGEVECDAG